MTKPDLYSASNENNTGYKGTCVPDKGVTSYDKRVAQTRGGIPFRIDLSL